MDKRPRRPDGTLYRSCEECKLEPYECKGFCIFQKLEKCEEQEDESRRMKKEAYCRWYDKKLEDVAEHEQEQCKENGQCCTDCTDLISKEYGKGIYNVNRIQRHGRIKQK